MPKYDDEKAVRQLLESARLVRAAIVRWMERFPRADFVGQFVRVAPDHYGKYVARTAAAGFPWIDRVVEESAKAQAWWASAKACDDLDTLSYHGRIVLRGACDPGPLEVLPGLGCRFGNEDAAAWLRRMCNSLAVFLVERWSVEGQAVLQLAEAMKAAAEDWLTRPAMIAAPTAGAAAAGSSPLGPMNEGTELIFRWGDRQARLSPRSFELADFIWKQAGHRATVADACQVWGHEPSDNAIAKAVQAANRAFENGEVPVSLHQRSGSIIFDLPIAEVSQKRAPESVPLALRSRKIA